MTCDIFGTGQTNILGLRYLFEETFKQPTVVPLKSLKSTPRKIIENTRKLLPLQEQAFSAYRGHVT